MRYFSVFRNVYSRVVDPDPDPGTRKLRNFSGKNALYSYLKKTTF
jgi:hypothetical protein